MMSVMWFMTLLVLQLVVHLGSTTLLEGEPRVCYQCNATSCAGAVTSSLCPAHAPYCATAISTPNVTSSLLCSPKLESPCSLTDSNSHLQLTCFCTTQLCNAPFTRPLQDSLLTFSRFLPNTTDLLNSFLNKTKYNLTDLYNELTETRNGSTMPQPQALKDTPAPDDDEDEGEGSGSEETRVRDFPAAPADPSSFLPAENKALTQYIEPILFTIPIFLLTTA